MRSALVGPFLVAAGLLCVSGAAKLRVPDAAVAALRTLGLPAGSRLVRAAAAVELLGGVVAGLTGGRAAALALAVVYAAFATLTALLARRRAACGCFGSDGAPAGMTQLLLSLSLVALAVAASVWAPAGIGGVLARSPGQAFALLVGVAGCIYALAVAYTELPEAWAAWSGR